MNSKIKKIDRFVKSRLSKDKTGHDYNHAIRILKTSRKIAKHYKKIDYEVLEASCLLHDIAFQKKFVKNHHLVGAKQAKLILKKFKFPENKIDKICRCIRNHLGQIQKPVENPKNIPIEAKILRDADNIDAIGSIGLIRMISFCASQKFPYFTSKKARFNDSVYSGVKALLEWPKSMLTPEGKKIGMKKLKIMKQFLKELEKEYI